MNIRLIPLILLSIQQEYTKKFVKTDKAKTGVEPYVDKDPIREESKDVIIGRIPVMVKSDLCWMKDAEKGDCEFDHGGYFIIKGAEKVVLFSFLMSLTPFLSSFNLCY